MALSSQLVTAAIPDDKDLAEAVQQMVASHPETAGVMTRLLTYLGSKQVRAQDSRQTPPTVAGGHGIAQYFNKQPPASATVGSVSFSSGSAPVATASKTGAAAAATSTTTREDLGPAIYSTNPLSFLHPVRKKLLLSLHQNHIALFSSTNTSEVVSSAPWAALYRVIAVPFLERATKHTALILFFRHDGISSRSSKDAIWVVPMADDGKDFALEFSSQHQQLLGLEGDLRLIAAKDPTRTPIPFVSPSTAATSNKRPDHLLISILSYCLNRAHPSGYTSSSVDIIPNPTPPYPNFSAHLKSNQGTIYLLPTGILFAFRKPILFLRSVAIEALGIHSVLSRTFDFEIVMDSTTDGLSTAEDLEGIPQETKGDNRRVIGFGMVDTKEFARMEEWIKKAGIRDRSMSEDLKAKDKAPMTAGSKKRGADSEDASSESGNQLSSSQQPESFKKQRAEVQNDNDDDDDEDDEDFAPESEDEIMEEYDSEAESEQDDEGSDEEQESIKRRERGKKDEQAAEEDEEDLEDDSEEEEDGEGEDDEEEEQAPSRHKHNDEEEMDELDED
ncbi:hypothetical protein EDD11_010323 [Mortierella claussenii]|nr:hypothetical protein EDD11_010323 [Mortierella claussenii]